MTVTVAIPVRNGGELFLDVLQALQAQSANIQGVSGASYTSAGFEDSLQSALTQLGFR